MNTAKTLGIVAIALWLFGCASGGGGAATSNPSGTSITPPPNPTPPSSAAADVFRTAEYNRMGALDQIHAADAYVLGFTGQGVSIGIVDFNFDFSSTEVNFSSASVGADAGTLAIYQAQIGMAPSTDQHGQAVATVAAGIKNNSGIHGVAFNAQVLAVDYFSNINETLVTQGGALYHVSDPWTYITSHGVRIINTSFGYEASDINSHAPLVHEYYVTESPALAVKNGALLVSSAGNGGGANPSQFNLDTIADLQSLGILDSGPGALIIAGAVDANNVIASFSDRAGTEKNYYMVAPGVNLVFPWNGSLAIGSGTSFSAPLISGAAATILQRWPVLSARQVADILFQSATDLGAPGVDPVYGHGLLNVYAALQPIGTTTLAVSGTGGPAVGATSVMLSPTFGDARSFRAALTNVTMFDGFGRDYQIDASHLVMARPSTPDLFGVMEQRLGWRQTSFAVGSATRLAFDIKRNPEDGIVPLENFSGPQHNRPHQAVFRLSGEDDTMGWTLGRGLSLSDALSRRSTADPFAAASLTGLFSPMAQSGSGNFATVSLPLDSSKIVSFGVYASENQGVTDELRTPFRNESEAAAARLDAEMGRSEFSLELGMLSETGGLLGSLAAGGLKMAERSSSAWASATAERALDHHWTLRASFTLAASGATHPVGSLISEIGPVYATSFALGLAGADVFGAGDALSFSFGQPLRAESATVALISGVGRDWSTGAVIMGRSLTSLLPSGREFDLETAYRFPLGAWAAEANAAYRLDPDHVQGARAFVTLLTLSRRF